MNKKIPTTSVLKSYRKRQNRTPFIIWGLAAFLGLSGLIILILSLTSSGGPKFTLFTTKTPTPTITFTPTNTSTPTNTPTITPTPTATFTTTPDAPFEYTIQEGDNLYAIAERYNLGDNGINLILSINPQLDPATIYVGQVILVPNPGMELPTTTPIPPDLPRGTEIQYTVQPGDTLAGIAAQFNSTADEIMAKNELEDANAIFVGQRLIVPVNLVTATATRPATSTPVTARPTDFIELPTLTPSP
ncbi:MAG: LysM peptidoglycan-binding domain-containing protein [Anaerolineales bacterium]|nr:LysM peptidoglycan-binding domain-containing protein [Anaerolineales bacterium]